MPPSNPNPTYYEILNLSPSTLTSQEEGAGGEAAATALIKRAYRRALLNHHPDKKPSPHQPRHPSPSSTTHTQNTYTIDQISTAYATLSRPAQRQTYDSALLLQRQSKSTTGGGGGGGAAFQTGIETIDLDDLECDEGGEEDGDGGETQWYRSCRCGNPRGYYFTEADLEDAADLGELMVGCADCSLWLRVCFAVVEESGDGTDDDGVGRQEGSGGSGGKGGTSAGAEDGER